MEYTDKEYCLRVKGDFACFTRPEMKVERVSYDVITPSAARAIFQAIFWKPAIQWEVTKIEVLAPIKHFSIRRNEVKKTMSTGSDGFYIGDERTQKASYILRDVDYRIHAKMVYLPPSQRSKKAQEYFEKEYSDEEKAAENPGKYQAIFERRAKAGQCFTMPYLGCREFTCSFELVEKPQTAEPAPINESKELGIMLYDMDFGVDGPTKELQRERKAKLKKPIPMFYYAEMNNGVIEVPSPDSDKILR